jgi:glutaredoxin 3
MSKRPEVTIYTTPWCSYCLSAKSILKRKGVAFREIDVQDPGERRAMMERAYGRRSVPQVFIDGRHVGGARELDELDRRGELDPLLQPA